MTSKSSPTDCHHRYNRVWTDSEARAVLPYVASIMGSLREHRLDALRHHLAARRLATKPGGPGRDTRLAQEKAARAASEADAEYQKALVELHSLGFRCLDSVAGLAVFTVYQDGDFAEYVYDLFESQHLRVPAANEAGRGQGRRAN